MTYLYNTDLKNRNKKKKKINHTLTITNIIRPQVINRFLKGEKNHLGPHRKGIGNNELKELRKILALAISVIVQRSANQSEFPPNTDRHDSFHQSK